MAISIRKSKGSIKAFGMEYTSFLKSNRAQKILLNALPKYLRWCLSHFGLMSSTYVWLNANSVDFIHSCFCPFLGRQILSAPRYANTRKYKIIPSHPSTSVLKSVNVPIRLKCTWYEGLVRIQWGTYRMYMITPRDQMSHDLSYFSGPRTSGAVEKGVIFDVFSSSLFATPLS